jgi:G:T-mismatch repair DNA endonuclease (very short patch repair protein)
MSNNRKQLDLELIAKLYCEDKLTTIDIANILGVCSCTINNRLREANVLRTKSQARLGKHYSPRTEWQKGCSAPSTAFQKGCVPWNRGKTGVYSAEHLEYMSQLKKGGISPNKGRPLSAETKKRLSLALHGRVPPNKGKSPSLETRRRNSEAHIGKKLSIEQRQHISEAHKRRGTPTDAERAKMLQGSIKRPTKPERQMDNLLQCHFPNEWRYTGNGEIIIAGLNPDFININGRKEIIEVFGEAFHDPEHSFMKVPYRAQEEGRRAIYDSYGFKMLVVWASELREPLTVVEKVRKFAESSDEA